MSGARWSASVAGTSGPLGVPLIASGSLGLVGTAYPQLFGNGAYAMTVVTWHIDGDSI